MKMKISLKCSFLLLFLIIINIIDIIEKERVLVTLVHRRRQICVLGSSCDVRKTVFTQNEEKSCISKNVEAKEREREEKKVIKLSSTLMAIYIFRSTLTYLSLTIIVTIFFTSVGYFMNYDSCFIKHITTHLLLIFFYFNFYGL